MITLELFQNIAILLSLSIAYQAILVTFPNKKWMYKFLSGLLFGGIGVLAMIMPLHITQGLIIDSRTVILSMAGLIAGPLSAFIAAGVCLIYRTILGGVGMWVGLGSITISTLCGILFYFLRRKRQKPFSILQIGMFGVVLHAFVLVTFLTLPGGQGLEIIRLTGIHFLLIYPLAGILLYLIFQDFESRLVEREALKVSQQRYELASEAS